MKTSLSLLSMLSLPICLSATACKTPETESTQKAAASEELDTKLDDMAYIKAEAKKAVADKANELGRPANRDFHSKGICAKGIFKVSVQDIPEGYREGIFAKDGEYAMYGRFSNGRPGRDSNDQDGSVFGFGIKLINVPGEKFDMQSLGSTKPRNTNQDWNLATGETFPIPTAEIYRQQRQSFARFAIRHPLIAKAIISGLRHIDSFLTTSYHSQVALHYGEDYITKFSVSPCNGVEKDITSSEAKGRSKDYLREDLQRKMAASGGCFLFNAQRRRADHLLTASNADWAQKYPSDNPSVLWPKSVIPYVTLAKIEFPRQQNITALQDQCEALSINPGNTLQQLRPIESDSLMRSRFLSAYEGSVTKRTEINGGVQTEPSPVADIGSWINE